MSVFRSLFLLLVCLCVLSYWHSLKEEEDENSPPYSYRFIICYDALIVFFHDETHTDTNRETDRQTGPVHPSVRPSVCDVIANHVHAVTLLAEFVH